MNERSVRPVLVLGTIAILAIDIGGLLLAKAAGFADEWLAIPSFLLFAAIGYAAGWRHSLAAAAYAGVAIAAIDTTVGWWFAWLIDPVEMGIGKVEDAFVLLIAAKLNLALNTALALGGGAVGRRVGRGREALRVA